METTNPIPQFPGYFADCQGNIWSAHKNRWGIGSKLRKLQPSRNNKYGRQILHLKHESGKIRAKYVHHLVLEAFCGQAPPDHEARHLNGDASDNRVENLRWGLREENLADMRKHGKKKGERHHRAAISDDDVREIRSRAEKGESHQSISNDFPIERRQVSRIVQRVRWGHVDALTGC